MHAYKHTEYHIVITTKTLTHVSSNCSICNRVSPLLLGKLVTKDNYFKVSALLSILVTQNILHVKLSA